VWDSEPLLPVTVTAYDPADPLHESVAEPDVPRGTLLGDIVQVRPVDGETVAESATVPANPFTLVAVKVEPPAVPEFTVTPAGLALKAKSCKMKVKVPE